MTKFSISGQYSTLSPEDQATLTLIERLGQEHLVANWPEPGQSTADKQRFLAQIRGLDARYRGGLERYLANAAELLQRSAAGDSPYQDYAPQIPTGYGFELGSPQYSELEALGFEAVNRCGFVLVAGGLGERLGFAGIKVALAAESATGRSFLEIYISHILALQERSNQRLGTRRQLPLAIMTSDDTDEQTEMLLRKHHRFGLADGQVTLLKQEPVAAIADPTPRLAVSPSDPFALITKPHGHGDVHALLHQSGLVQRWLEQGIRWLQFFQDTNALAFYATLAALGVSVRDRLDVNSIVVPRRAGEAVGGLVRLVKPDSELTINVEYNQLDALLRSAPGGAGDVADHTGYSPYPGNTNIFILALPAYAETLKRTGGAVPEFVNPKYVDASRTAFKSPTRLECMMQDYPRLAPTAHVAFTQFDRAVCFSPVKNSLDVAASRSAQHPPLPPESASTGEADLYYLQRHILQLTGARLEPGPVEHYHGIPVVLFPVVVLSPDLTPPLLTDGSLRTLRVSSRSALILLTSSIEIQGLELDGALEVRAVRGARITLRNLAIKNRSWTARALNSNDTVAAELAIRGFCFEKHETLVICANRPGDYIVDALSLCGTVPDPEHPGWSVLYL